MFIEQAELYKCVYYKWEGFYSSCDGLGGIFCLALVSRIVLAFSVLTILTLIRLHQNPLGNVYVFVNASQIPLVTKKWSTGEQKMSRLSQLWLDIQMLLSWKLSKNSCLTNFYYLSVSARSKVL